MRLHGVSKEVVAALLPLTTHKRHRVRIAAIQALKVVMHQVILKCIESHVIATLLCHVYEHVSKHCHCSLS